MGERQLLFWTVVLAATFLLIGLLRDVLLPFVLGVALAYLLNPLVGLLVRARLPRVVATALVLLVGIGVIAAAVATLAPLVLDQLQRLAVAMPEQLQKVRTIIEDIARQRLGTRYQEFAAAINGAIDGIVGNGASIANTALNTVVSQTRSLVSLVSILLITPLVAFYVLVDWHPMMARIDGWLPREHAPTIRRLGSEISAAISAFLRGQGLVCLILAVFYAVALQAIGLQYGLVVGLATGLFSFVPFVGWALGFIVSLVLAVAQFWPATTPLVIVAAIFIAGQVLDAAVLSPAIVGSRLGLHPVWLLFALLAFSSLFGFVGTLVAVPVAAAMAVLVRFGLDSYLASTVYKGREVP